MKKWSKYFLTIPDFIYRIIWKRIGQSRDKKLASQFRLFYPGTPAELELMVANYRCRQIGIILLFLVTVMVFVFCVGKAGDHSSSAIRIWRNGYGEGTKEEQIVLEDGETITFTVGEQEYGEQELEKAFQNSFQWVREHMLMENAEASDIRSDLNFMTEVPGGFCAEWISMMPEVINHDGKVQNDDWLGEKSRFVDVQLQLSYQEHVRIQELHFCVREPMHTAREELILKIKQSIAKEEELSREKESFVIPGVLEGVALKQPEENRSYGIYLLAGAFFIFLFFYQKNRMEDEGKERYRQLEEDYPVLINKLVLYLGAGINLRKTFQQIAKEYTEDVHAGQIKKRYMYEELVVMVNEMDAGTGEQQAYEAFGYRMEQNSYTKLISLLVQNLQKGNDGLLNALKEEEANAFFLRIDHAKKLAEEAGTKLLFPMLLMLLIVMAIVMAPALFQFGAI